MSKLNKILLVVIIVVVIAFGIMTYLYFNMKNAAKQNLELFLKQSEETMHLNEKIHNLENTDDSDLTESLNSKVVIKNGQIKNEKLIDEFINLDRKDDKSLEIENEEGITKLEFFKSEINLETQNEDGSITTQIPQYTGEMSQSFDVEFAKKYYGYYKITYPDKTVSEYSPLAYNIKKMIKDDKVIVYFNIWLPSVDVAVKDVLHTICEYNIESSNYKKKFDIKFNQRKDMGIDTIADKGKFDNSDYKICTLGGDVNFTIEDDKIVEFRKALENKLITADDMLEQIKLDTEYGVCTEEMYSDGGSKEYLYDSYTILKCNTLDGNKDLYIGPKGAILNYIDN